MVAHTDMDGWLHAGMISEITEIIKHKRHVMKGNYSCSYPNWDTAHTI